MLKLLLTPRITGINLPTDYCSRFVRLTNLMSCVFSCFSTRPTATTPRTNFHSVTHIFTTSAQDHDTLTRTLTYVNLFQIKGNTHLNRSDLIALVCFTKNASAATSSGR